METEKRRKRREKEAAKNPTVKLSNHSQSNDRAGQRNIFYLCYYDIYFISTVSVLNSSPAYTDVTRMVYCPWFWAAGKKPAPSSTVSYRSSKRAFSTLSFSVPH